MLYLLIATICFSLSFGLIKSQLSVLPSEFVVIFRLLFAVLIFLPFCKKLNLKQHFKVFFIGMVQFGLMYLCFIKAFKYLQGNEVAILTTTTPVFVAIWSGLLGEKFKPAYILCILFSVIGAGVIVWQNTEFSMLVKGIFLMESCNCSFALGQVLWKKYINAQAENLMATAYLGAFVFVFPFMFLDADITSINLNMTQFLSLLYLAVIPTGMGFWLWNKGAQKVKYSTLAVMNNLKIPLGVLFAVLFFNEKINIINFIIGSCIIFCSIVLLNILQKE